MLAIAKAPLLVVAVLLPFGAEALEKCRPVCNDRDYNYLQRGTVPDLVGWPTYVAREDEPRAMQAVLTGFCLLLLLLFGFTCLAQVVHVDCHFGCARAAILSGEPQ
jgi:hypothetical protein